MISSFKMGGQNQVSTYQSAIADSRAPLSLLQLGYLINVKVFKLKGRNRLQHIAKFTTQFVSMHGFMVTNLKELSEHGIDSKNKRPLCLVKSGSLRSVLLIGQSGLHFLIIQLHSFFGVWVQVRLEDKARLQNEKLYGCNQLYFNNETRSE